MQNNNEKAAPARTAYTKSTSHLYNKTSHNQARSETIALSLGGKRIGRGWICRCPAHDDRSPSLSVADGDDGRLLVHCFAGCDPHDLLAVLQQRGLIDGHSGRSKAFNYPIKQKQSEVSCPPLEWSLRAELVWQKTVPISETAAEAYLRYRGCMIPNCNDLRFLPIGEVMMYPAMIARITDAITGKPLSLHFTYLLPDGRGKAPVERPKILLKGHRSKGGVIRLTDDAEVTTGLGIAEGIETALCCNWLPIWATVHANNMADFPVLDGIESLAIFADNDKSGTGLKAAKQCAERWRIAGREAKIAMPAHISEDWADYE